MILSSFFLLNMFGYVSRILYICLVIIKTIIVMNKNKAVEELSEQIMSMDVETRMKLVLRILALTIYDNNKNGNGEGAVMDLELSFSDELSIISKNELIFK